MEPTVELFHLRRSHYNEKARWALAYKGVRHRRTPLLLGLHLRPMKRLTGQTLLPAVRFGETFVCDSAKIIEALEERFPSPPLYPEALEQRRRALEVQAHFDTRVGPAVRAGLFSRAIATPGEIARVFGDHISAPRLAAYALGMRLAGPRVLKPRLRLEDPEYMRQAFASVREGFDYVDKHAGPSGHLVGDTFTVADLAAAALLAVAVDIDHADPDMAMPEPRPAFMAEWYAEWADHPGTEWVREMYRRYRTAPLVV